MLKNPFDFHSRNFLIKIEIFFPGFRAWKPSFLGLLQSSWSRLKSMIHINTLTWNTQIKMSFLVFLVNLPLFDFLDKKSHWDASLIVDFTERMESKFFFSSHMLEDNLSPINEIRQRFCSMQKNEREKNHVKFFWEKFGKKKLMQKKNEEKILWQKKSRWKKFFRRNSPKKFFGKEFMRRIVNSEIFGKEKKIEKFIKNFLEGKLTLIFKSSSDSKISL